MRIRSVVALARGSERRLSRQVDPRGLGFQVYLVRQVVMRLDEHEGRHRSHTLSAWLAVGLARLGVAGAALDATPARAHDASVVTGVLDRTHRARRDQPPRPRGGYHAAAGNPFPLPTAAPWPHGVRS
jgi:hypothetical protein